MFGCASVCAKVGAEKSKIGSGRPVQPFKRQKGYSNLSLETGRLIAKALPDNPRTLKCRDGKSLSFGGWTFPKLGLWTLGFESASGLFLYLAQPEDLRALEWRADPFHRKATLR